jgi:uncharacterized protein (TIGR00725 family)
MKQKVVAVIGGNSIDKHFYDFAYQVGKLIAEYNCIMICGGLGGVMEAAAKGAYENEGMTIGILPGFEKKDANPYISIPIITGLSTARNIIIARTCDIAVAIDGKYGTLSEIAYCLDFGKTVLGYRTHNIDKVIPIKKPEDIIKYL